MKHLFVDISSHGFDHLAQTAPVLNALAAQRPLQLTIRSGLAHAQLALRIEAPFTHLPEASDFGFVMHDALHVDQSASATRYRAAFADWPQRVAAEAALLQQLRVDGVLANVAPLPLAGAQATGIPAIAMCSLNWADLFAHYYGAEDWAAPIHAALHAAYVGATRFLRLTPGMPMPDLPNRQAIGPLAMRGNLDRAAVAARLGLPLHKRWLLLAMGGIAHRLPVEDWPQRDDLQLLVPEVWGVKRPDCTAFADSRLPFAELLPNVDAVFTKPGYGTFAEAACSGVPVLYLPRPDWPEAGFLEDWLQEYNRAARLAPAQAANGDFMAVLDALLAQPAPPRPAADGLAAALRCINAMLDANATIAA